jgi:hypothetical protein
MNPRAAVSGYPVNNFGKCERFSQFLTPVGIEHCLKKREGKNKKAGVNAGLFAPPCKSNQ